jgi:hypothetical protein
MDKLKQTDVDKLKKKGGEVLKELKKKAGEVLTEEAD